MPTKARVQFGQVELYAFAPIMPATCWPWPTWWCPGWLGAGVGTGATGVPVPDPPAPPPRAETTPPTAPTRPDMSPVPPVAGFVTPEAGFVAVACVRAVKSWENTTRLPKPAALLKFGSWLIPLSNTATAMPLPFQPAFQLALALIAAAV